MSTSQAGHHLRRRRMRQLFALFAVLLLIQVGVALVEPRFRSWSALGSGLICLNGLVLLSTSLKRQSEDEAPNSFLVRLSLALSLLALAALAVDLIRG